MFAKIGKHKSSFLLGENLYVLSISINYKARGDNMSKKYEIAECKLVDVETGEIIDGKDVDDVHLALVEKGGRVLNPAQIEYLRKQELRYRDKTPYIWGNFKYNKPYFPDVEDVNIPRMIFFSTFCNDSGYVMTNQDIKDMLSISYNHVKKFKDNLTQQKIISIRNNKVYVSNNAFYIGTLQDTDTDFVRIFIDANRRLYSACTPTQHKQLSYVYRMTPYLNRQTNILSHNQHEQDIDRIEYMSFKEFCDIVGYDSSHSARLSTDLSQFRIYGELAVGFFDDLSELKPKGKYVVVNPHLLFGGERELKAYKDICKLFKAEKESDI